MGVPRDGGQDRHTGLSPCRQDVPVVVGLYKTPGRPPVGEVETVAGVAQTTVGLVVAVEHISAYKSPVTGCDVGAIGRADGVVVGPGRPGAAPRPVFPRKEVRLLLETVVGRRRVGLVGLGVAVVKVTLPRRAEAVLVVRVDHMGRGETGRPEVTGPAPAPGRRVVGLALVGETFQDIG